MTRSMIKRPTGTAFDPAQADDPATVRKREKATLRQDRKRARERAKTQPTADRLTYARPDWQLFLDKGNLPQKGGFAPHQIGRVVVKELTDNALDEGARVKCYYDPDTHTYTISDDGPGIAPDKVPEYFSVNRGLVSSKALKHLPLRGMLGNGLRVVMGAVCAYEGTISVTSRGHRLSLSVNPVTGLTEVARDDTVAVGLGTIVAISLPVFNGNEQWSVMRAISANRGHIYSGPPRPEWHNAVDLGQLFRNVSQDTATVADVLADVFAVASDDTRPARDLQTAEVKAIHTALVQRQQPPAEIGDIGPGLYEGCTYHRVSGTTTIEGRRIPYTVECWAECERAERDGEVSIDLLLNRSPSLARLYGSSYAALEIEGCGLDFAVKGAKKALYTIHLSLIAPYIPFVSDGKEPALVYFHDACATAIRKATVAAYKAMVRPPREISVKNAAWEVMAEAFHEVADNPDGDPPVLPANARQIMYKARPKILLMTGVERFTDSYFTQTLLPDFLSEHPDLCADWDVTYDARGNLIEPHTGVSVPLGTLEVRQYLGQRPRFGPVAKFPFDVLYPTSGLENRYRNLLYIEKEGFDALIDATRLRERYDIVTASSKGFSVTAVRELIDGLVTRGLERVFVLHDFDVSGFSIAGTLTTDSRRYTYDNEVEMIDIGLRLDDVRRERLEWEPVTIKSDLDVVADTLRERGADDDEIDFLLGRDDTGQTKRVELNAMTSRQFIAFIEGKLAEHGVEKVVPRTAVLAEHARRLFEQKLIRDEIEVVRPDIAEAVAAYQPPDDLFEQVYDLLAQQPEFSWDAAVADVLGLREA